MRQTAVEWLLFEMSKFGLLSDGIPKEIHNQAKEIEKQQIIDAHGKKTKQSRGISNYTYILTGEEYYNETFKNK